MQTDDSVDAPADSIKWSKDLFRTRQKQPSAVERIKAALKIDIAPGTAVFGERSGTAEARQMLFEAGDRAVDLRIKPEAEGYTVQGQALGEGFENFTATMAAIVVSSNEQGEFAFEGIKSGTYDLSLNNGDEEIVIEGIEIS